MHLLGALVAEVAVRPEPVRDGLHLVLVREMVPQEQWVVGGFPQRLLESRVAGLELDEPVPDPRGHAHAPHN